MVSFLRYSFCTRVHAFQVSTQTDLLIIQIILPVTKKGFNNNKKEKLMATIKVTLNYLLIRLCLLRIKDWKG